MSAMQEPEQSVAIDVVGDGGIALSGVTFQDDTHLCAPLAGYDDDDDDDDDDEALEDPQLYQYVSDSEQEDSGGLREEEDDWQGVLDDLLMGTLDPEANPVPVDFADTPDGPPVLTKEEEKRADEIASQILMAQLVEAPWFKSELPNAVIQEIVERAQR
ncbi:hypothetical protein BGX33_004183 [Mortierella sp. NVP41]|nr:hypothetical protein BGX33_004183 [Mortierella sp. NVP41]